MSYDIDLIDQKTGDCAKLPMKLDLRQGTYVVGGDDHASINITYNYGAILRKVLDPEEGIRVLYGKTGMESWPLIATAISKLADDTDEDYWKATEGNVKIALIQMMHLAVLCPTAVWQGD